jgi:uncharacterized protein (TIGR03067 family)
MESFRHIITLACVIASFRTHAGEQLAATPKCAANPPIAAELQLLQGTWEGVREEADAGEKSTEKITITITGSSFHFHRDTNFWFETTISLPPGTEPKQLHATIKNCPPAQADSIGKVVGAIYKVEDGTLTLADYVLPGEPPKSFAAAMSRYVMKKLQPAGKSAEPPKTQ